jgi:glycerophosphoryl diester phosphodiesterase
MPRIQAAIESGRFDCLMAHHRLVDSDLIARMTACGGEVYAWTVDTQVAMDRLLLLGVAGITTNDPRLFRTFT